MPLMRSPSKKAFSKNVETEMDAGKPQGQSLAIAYDIKRKNSKKKFAKGGVAAEYGADPEKDANPGTPAKKPDDTRYPDNATMSEDWSKGSPSARKPDDKRRPKSAFMDTNDWSDGEKPSRKPFADGGTVLTSKPNVPRPSQASTESEDLNAKALRQGSTPAQMAEYHEQEGARYRMMAQGGVATVDGMAEEDGYMGTPPRKADDYRFPADEYMSTDKWSKGEAPARKPDDMRLPKSEYDNGARFAKGGKAENEMEIEPMTDEEMENETSKKPLKVDAYDPSQDPGADAIEPEPFADGGEAEGHYESVAEAIMAKKRKKYADGGMVNLDQNAQEEFNNEDQMSFNALRKENYSENAGLKQMGSPEDSNQKGRSLPDEDRHDKANEFRSDVDYQEHAGDDTDMLNDIMKKMRTKRSKDDSKV